MTDYEITLKTGEIIHMEDFDMFQLMQKLNLRGLRYSVIKIIDLDYFKQNKDE